MKLRIVASQLQAIDPIRKGDEILVHAGVGLIVDRNGEDTRSTCHGYSVYSRKAFALT